MPSQDGLLQGGAIGQLSGSIVERRGLPSLDIFWSRRSLPLLLGFSLYGRRRRIFDLQPVADRPALRRPKPLGHDALAAERARVLVDDRAFPEVPAERDALMPLFRLAQ